MNKIKHVLAIVSLSIFIIFAFIYKTEAIHNLDQWWSTLLGGNIMIGYFHYIGETIFVASITALLVIYLFMKKQLRLMTFVLLTIVGGTILNQAAKAIFQRPRPNIIDQLNSYSFPSGHSMLGIIYLFTIAYLLTRNLKGQRKKLLIWFLALVLMLLIGFSRVAESRHYISDVFAGWSFGLGWFMVCTIWYERKNKDAGEL